MHWNHVFFHHFSYCLPHYIFRLISPHVDSFSHTFPSPIYLQYCKFRLFSSKHTYLQLQKRYLISNPQCLPQNLRFSTPLQIFWKYRAPNPLVLTCYQLLGHGLESYWHFLLSSHKSTNIAPKIRL
jgi:hypothetical protein